MSKFRVPGSLIWIALLCATLAASERGTVSSEDRLEGDSTEGEGRVSQPVRELNKQILPLPEGSPLEYPDATFAALHGELATARVVGLGEATHGTAEFAEIKHRLFRYLVEVHGHRALAHEYSFAASLDVDRWVVDGTGSLDSQLEKALWIQNTTEVRDLLLWIRKHNSTLPREQRVRFLGIDTQLDIWNLERHEMLFLDRFPEIHRRLSPYFRQLREMEKVDYRKLTAERYQEILDILGAMADIVTEESNGVTDPVAAHLIEALERSHEFLYDAYQGNNDIRDRHLADNAMWVRDLLGRDVPFAIWAHNAHVASDPEYYGEGGACSMGEYLQSSLGPGYYRIGTAFSRGDFVAVTADEAGRDTAPMEWHVDIVAPAGSVNWLLQQGARSRFLLPLRQLPKDGSLRAYLDEERGLFGIGDFWAQEVGPHLEEADRRIRVSQAFDALFYFTDTHGVHLRATRP